MKTVELLEPEEAYEPLKSDIDHADHMKRGSFALLLALNKARGITAPPEKGPAVTLPPRRKPRLLWPAWYKPPRQHKFGIELLNSVAGDFGLTVTEMRGQGREGFLVDARAVAAMLLRERGLSYPQIARMIGRKDHSTVLNLTGKFDIFCNRNPLVRESYERHRDAA